MKKTLNNNQINKLRKEARKFYENLKDDPSFISLGAGVQSSTLLLLYDIGHFRPNARRCYFC